VSEPTSLESALRRAYDANVRYWETVGRATTDYVQTVSKLWAEAPLSWIPPARPAAGTASSGNAEAPQAAALLLEGAEGTGARAVVMLSNDLNREVEAAVVASALMGPGGETVGLKLRTDPEVVKLAPGSRVPVALMVDITDRLEEGADYRGEVNVPGLSPRGVPVIVRRRARS
jgi:hypothetical protein